jgi:N-acetylglutamate synthase/N-acetylornithine aminotransferase
MCPGFKFAGVASGLKKNGRKDLALIYSETIANVAGVFTRNQVKAAPVILDMQRIVSGTCQAVIANSGNANCCTGEEGIRDAILTARWTAQELNLPEEQCWWLPPELSGNRSLLIRFKRRFRVWSRPLSQVGYLILPRPS